MATAAVRWGARRNSWHLFATPETVGGKTLCGRSVPLDHRHTRPGLPYTERSCNQCLLIERSRSTWQ